MEKSDWAIRCPEGKCLHLPWVNAARWPSKRWRDAVSALHWPAGPLGRAETCYRYSPKLKDENEEIADLLVGLTDARKTWGFGVCFLHLRNVKGHPWNHKRVYRIYCALELNLRSEPSRRHRFEPDGERPASG